MKIAIVGAGFSGLSLAWHLLNLSASEITLFDPLGVGGGASGSAPGLLHPYVGEYCRRSLMASEGLSKTEALIAAAQAESSLPILLSQGIIRIAQNEEQEKTLLEQGRLYKDVEEVGPRQFLIRSGMTVHCMRYLEGLLAALSKKGVVLKRERIHSLQELEEFDCIALTAGAGLKAFPEAAALRLRLSKGQVLKVRTSLERSCIGKGYLAVSEEPGICFLGSTYEKQYLSEAADVGQAKSELLPKFHTFFPERELEVLDCRAAIRVVRQGHYAPLIGKLSEKAWVMTALGSRGLLYHGLLGELLAQAMLSGSEAQIPSIFRLG